ncbi:glycoside hydrolase family 31 protein [Reichenbachiella carrageenanivorans]|uniref:Glycoside hydrolase family 31 protein n=1 Tax=Reichenbachiella carrageenanivorans TaxID=2979869 RepID=A0ABY6D4Y8_9BACT|nr:glycoside hydrolase family 31 protein [Reichenbachiella carrageenanivorans]UXX80964.1 glycoside hydrolase family 31 protein [Reichenbachiella carrageenanivorans]
MKTYQYFTLSLLTLALCFIMGFTLYSEETIKTNFQTRLLAGEVWWGGLSVDGPQMPFSDTTQLERNLFGVNKGNQAQPLLISSKGRYIWCEDPMSYSFDNGTLSVQSSKGEIITGTAGKTIVDAFNYSSANFFPSNGQIPDPFMFKEPQYNTWIELTYNQNEEDILQYAQDIVDHGYPPGVLMIDDTWQENYGDWEFAARRFKDPKGMIEKLHALGFKVMLWVCPFISADSDEFRYLAAEGMLILDEQKSQDILWANTQNKAAIVRWWNGASAVLDLSNPRTREWFQDRLDYLVDEYGVDGYKFDAGDAHHYDSTMVSFVPGTTPNDHTTYFAKVGLKYPLNEYRASWKMAGLPLVQRLRDKFHKWEDLQKLIPGIISEGLMGYAYVCPDMIGGGAYRSFLEGSVIDEELVVRSAQVHALMPMMQFSVAPWRVLSSENQRICQKMAALHSSKGDLFVDLALEASKSGKPIARPLIYNYPNKEEYIPIIDQFMIGTDLLVAPVVQKGERSRSVVFPKGKWKGDDGSIVRGPTTVKIEVPLDRLPYYERLK